MLAQHWFIVYDKAQHWFIVYDSDKTLIKHWGDVSRLLRHPIYFFYFLEYTLYYDLNLIEKYVFYS